MTERAESDAAGPLVADSVRPRSDSVYVRVVVGALVGLAIGTILTFGLASRTGSTSTLIHFAPPNTDASLAPDSVVVLPETRGYDGQFYYRLAEHPLSTADQIDGVRLDHPALRATRIGYPALAGAIALTPISTVDAMLLVNVLAYGVIGAAGVSIAASAGRNPLLGMTLLFVPAFIYGATMSVTDTLAGALVLAGIALLLRDHFIASATALSAAVLTRETALLLPAVLVLGMLYRRLRGRSAPGDKRLLVVGLAPIACFSVWQGFVVWNWGEIGPLSSGGKNLTAPFLGPFVTDGYLSPSSTEQWMNILVPAAAFAIIGLAVIAVSVGEVRNHDANLTIGFGVAVVVAVSVGPALLETYRSSVRAMGDAVIFGVVAAMFGTGRWSRTVLAGVVVVGAGLMLWELRIAPDQS